MAVDDSYTKLLLHMNGDDNGTAFTDEAGHTATVVGNACTKTGTKKFGTAAGYFDGTGDYLNFGDQTDFEFGSGDFTIDFWVNLGSVAVNQSMFSKHAMGVYDEYYCYFSGAGTLRFYATTNGTSWNVTLTSNTAMSINTWYHIAIVRNGNVWTMYQDGNSVATVTVSGTVPTSSQSLHIAHCTLVGVGRYATGYMDEFRISKGIARWTESFTPPTAPYGGSAPPPVSRRFAQII